MNEKQVKASLNDEPLRHESTIMLPMLEKLLEDYIPSPLLRNFEKSKINFDNTFPAANLYGVVQLILDNSNNQLRMYGSAVELFNNLRIFHNFPMRFKKLRTQVQDPSDLIAFETCPYIFQSLSGKHFMRKIDCVVHIHANSTAKFFRKLCKAPAEYVECMEENIRRLDGCNDYVIANKEMLNEINRNLNVMMHNNLETGGPLFPRGHNFQNNFGTMIQSLVPPMNMPGPSHNSEKISDVEALKRVVNSHSQLFKPYSEMNDPDYPVVVRIFEDFECQNFVMESELFNNRIMKSHSPRNTRFNGMLNTLDYDHVQNKYPDLMKDIEFIPVPIKRAKHAAVPIVTPFGDHCILASDALLEILRRLITSLKVFETIGSNKQQKINDFMSFLESKFPVETECKLFMKSKEFDKLKAKTDITWTKERRLMDKKKHVHQIKDIGLFGFSAEDLKNELINLGITNMFPDITSLVDQAYSTVLEYRRSQFLRTNDMYDAVELCQLVCLLEKYPKLKKFLHTQQACIRIPMLQCESCESKYDIVEELDRGYKEYTTHDIKVFYSSQPNDRHGISAVMDLRDSRTIVPNLKFLTFDEISKENTKYFLLDDDDLRWALASGKCLRISINNPNIHKELDDVLKSLTNFVKYRPNKKIYIRTIRNETSTGVFIEDVSEVIPILLKQQKSIGYEDKLKMYRNEWKCIPPYKLISTRKFISILKKFNIDRTLVTIVPDLTQIVTNDATKLDRSLYTCLVSPTGIQVMSNHTAILDIFQMVVCGLNWKMDYCKTHSNCKEDFKKEIINAMTEYLEMEKESYISCTSHNAIIKKLQEHCTYIHQKRIPTYRFEIVSHYTSLIPICDYILMCSSFGLKDCLSRISSRDASIPIWAYRSAYVYGWCEAFFDKHPRFHELIRKLTVYKLPWEVLSMENMKTIQELLDLPISFIHSASTPRSTWSRLMENSTDDESSSDVRRSEVQEKTESVTVVQTTKDQEPALIPDPDPSTIAAKVSNKDSSEFESAPDTVSIPSTVDESCEKCVESHRKVVELEKELKELRDLEMKRSEEMERKWKQEVIDKDKEIAELAVFHSKSMIEKDKEMEQQKQAYSELMIEKEELFNSKNKEINGFKMSTEQLEMTINQLTSIKLSMEVEKEVIEKENKKMVNNIRREHSRAMKRKNKEIDNLKLKSSKLEDELKAKINEKEAEIALRALSDNETASASANEIQLLRAEITDKEAMEALLKQTNTQLIDSNRQLVQKMTVLQEKFETEQSEMAMKQSDLENELKEKELVILDLQESRIQQAAEQEKAKEELHEKISTIFNQCKNQFDGVLNELVSSTPQDSALIISLQKTRDKLRDDSPLKLAKEMMEKLISLSSRSEIHQMAQYEYEQYEGKVSIYLQELEVSIDKLNDKSCMTTPPFPSQFPSFSDRFMNEYWMEIDKSRDQKEDNECLICFFEMTHEMDTLKCEECKKVIHMECASKWLKIHRSCPHCRREQLDPNEFPALQ